MKDCVRIFNGWGLNAREPARGHTRARGTLLFPLIAAVIIGCFQVFFPSTVDLGRFLLAMGVFSLIAYAISFSALPYGRFRRLIIPSFIIAGTILFWLLHEASTGHEVIYYITVSQLILWGYTLVRTDFHAVLITCWTLSFIALLIVKMPPYFPNGADVVGITLLVAVNLLGFYIIRSTRRLTGLIHSLSRKANTDEVTGVANRHYFTELMRHECARVKRAKQPLALLLIDIDHFKAINDRYGHPAGDVVLRTLTRCITRTIRASDICGRYGGDEFVILLTDSTSAGARLTAQRLIAAIAASNAVDHGRRIEFNISVGIAGYQATSDCSLEALIRVADKALYQAKQEGRNRIRVAPESGEAERGFISYTR